MGFDHGIEKENVGILGLGKDAIGIGNFVGSSANGDEMGEDLVGLVKVMTEEVGVDLSEMGWGFVAGKEAEDSPLDVPVVLAHVMEIVRYTERRRRTELQSMKLGAGGRWKWFWTSINNILFYLHF
ncbi:hypothetical protein SDJN03_18961, partial [Cucurbita argyrosperma subsp. sororia]